MKKPGLAENEQERIEALHQTGILDTPVEERFDRITRIAERVFKVPIALLSIVDEKRQWFKSCIGLTVTETSREISFCGHAILGDDTFVVEDTLLDLRFVDNPLVTGDPFIRFYAGYPIRIGKDAKLGTLCIIDRKPRRFDAADRALLVDLGRIVESELVDIEISVTDELTRVLNRRGFDMILKNNLSICRRNLTQATLVYLDLDKFKPINDRFGHQAGDRLLSDFANILVASFRASDVVARLGGDEFIVLLNNAGADEAEMALEALKTLVAGYNAEQEEGLRIAFSHGSISFDPEQNQPIEDLISEADRRMYLNKRRTAA